MNKMTPFGVLAAAVDWQLSHVVVATVVATYGSAPRPAGSMLITDGTRVVGSISGGCLENEVIGHAESLLAAGRDQKNRPAFAEIKKYGITDEAAWEHGLSCGGEVTIHLECMEQGTLEHWHTIAAEQKGWERLCSITALAQANNSGQGQENAAIAAITPHKLHASTGNNTSFIGVHPLPQNGGYLQRCPPPQRIVIVGAVHITQCLIPLATTMGYTCLLIDPRATWANQTRFPNTDIINAFPDDALTPGDLDAQTALVTLTHDGKIDDPALMVGLRSQAGYIGALGSRRTHAKRTQRLQAQGFTLTEIERIHAPIGLPLGGSTAECIALAIMAEITATAYHHRLSLA